MPRAKRELEVASKRPSKGAAGDPAEQQQHQNPRPTGSASLDEEIRRRAYEIYQARGGQGGSPDEDWYRAETEVRAHRNQRSA